MKREVIIIGGGASGLFAAIMAADRGCRVTILDANEKAGKKILVTGNGRCNLSNMEKLNDKYYCNDQQFIDLIFDRFSNMDVKTAFNRLGVALKDKKGYIYPNSMQASTISSALISACQIQGVRIINNCTVTRVEVQKNGRFKINTLDNQTYSADRVLMAFGSRAGLKTDIPSYLLNSLKVLGHTIITPTPALCSVFVKMQDESYRCFFKNAGGVRSEIKATLNIDGKPVKEYSGELQITEYGLSGIVIFQLSRMISRTLLQNKQSEIYIIIDFLPEYTTDEVLFMLKSQQYYDKKSLLDLYSGLINQKLALGLIHLFSEHMNPDIKPYMKQLPDDILRNSIDFIKQTPFLTDKTNDFIRAQVCSGGVDISCINPVTLESKLVKNLYFSGECMDVDGICGGYNLQWAWSTGYIAGRSLSND